MKERNHVAVITSQSRLNNDEVKPEPERRSVNKSKNKHKKDNMGKKRMKALQDRIQNAIEFRDKKGPLTFVSPAPITTKIHR